MNQISKPKFQKLSKQCHCEKTQRLNQFKEMKEQQ